MHDEPHSLQSVGDICRAVLRHKFKGLAFFAVTLSLVTVGVFVYPKTYSSEARLFVRLGRESITLDPTATTGQNISVYESRESEMTSVLDVIQSRIIVENVVDKLGVEKVLLNPASAKNPRDEAILSLQKAIKVSAAKKSSVITITCLARSPQLAQQILQAFLDAFGQQHLHVNRTAGSYEFFVEQSELLGRKLLESQKELRDAKNEIGLTSIDGQRRSLQDQVTAIESARHAAENSLAASDASIASLRKAIATLPELLLTQEVTGFANSALDRSRDQLAQLQIRERDLLSKYTPQHPQVQSIRQQISEAEMILNEQMKESRQSTSSSNTAKQQLQVNLYTEEANNAALRARVTSLGEQITRMHDRLRVLNDHEGKIERLQRNVELLQLSHRAYQEKLEQSRIDKALEQDRISNVNVIQPPSLVAKAVSPKKTIILILGFMAATLGGLGLTLLWEYVLILMKRPESLFAPTPAPATTAFSS